jgi:hypothetical protein
MKTIIMILTLFYLLQPAQPFSGEKSVLLCQAEFGKNPMPEKTSLIKQKEGWL